MGSLDFGKIQRDRKVQCTDAGGGGLGGLRATTACRGPKLCSPQVRVALLSDHLEDQVISVSDKDFDQHI